MGKVNKEEIKNPNSGDDEIKRLLEKNLEISQDLQTQIKKIKRAVNLMRVTSFLQVLIIVIPIILGIIYLPPVFDKVFGGLVEFYEKIMSLPTSR